MSQDHHRLQTVRSGGCAVMTRWIAARRDSMRSISVRKISFSTSSFWISTLNFLSFVNRLNFAVCLSKLNRKMLLERGQYETGRCGLAGELVVDRFKRLSRLDTAFSVLVVGASGSAR
ncbi:hypothetical protein N7471_002202 [Penicillium samsonianum]|uniref:uncharacterized protein n=1 Tax=Penicillium samsonianum TaxID=1882272 RepID=UPI002548CC8B|nr:uncharacterized protein N7471_002202 [Penicillium samsonianum]KAJ6142749.1 hypothetical protein N7471_002202 [Penicillium samsonianum]